MALTRAQIDYALSLARPLVPHSVVGRDEYTMGDWTLTYRSFWGYDYRPWMVSHPSGYITWAKTLAHAAAIVARIETAAAVNARAIDVIAANTSMMLNELTPEVAQEGKAVG